METLSFHPLPPGWRHDFCAAPSTSCSLLGVLGCLTGAMPQSLGVRNGSVFTLKLPPVHTWLPSAGVSSSCEMDSNVPRAVKDAGLDQRGQWGRAKAVSGPCPFLPVSPQRPFPLLLLSMAADLFCKPSQVSWLSQPGKISVS